MRYSTIRGSSRYTGPWIWDPVLSGFSVFPCWNALAESDCKAADPVGTESVGWCAAGCGGWPAVYMAGWAGDQSLLRNAVDTATSDAD